MVLLSVLIAGDPWWSDLGRTLQTTVFQLLQACDQFTYLQPHQPAIAISLSQFIIYKVKSPYLSELFVYSIS